MQTFLPYPDFAASMAALDNARLGKQRVEAYQILRQLAGTTRGWRNHPAVKMWRGYEPALFAYTVAACDEWVRRGFRNDMGETIRQEFPQLVDALVELPPWLGRDDIHSSHRGNLLRKSPDHYAALGWTDPPDLPYVWPIPGGRDPAFWGEAEGGMADEAPAGVWSGDAKVLEALDGDPITNEAEPSRR